MGYKSMETKKGQRCNYCRKKTSKTITEDKICYLCYQTVHRYMKKGYSLDEAMESTKKFARMYSADRAIDENEKEEYEEKVILETDFTNSESEDYYETFKESCAQYAQIMQIPPIEEELVPYYTNERIEYLRTGLTDDKIKYLMARHLFELKGYCDKEHLKVAKYEHLDSRAKEIMKNRTMKQKNAQYESDSILEATKIDEPYLEEISLEELENDLSDFDETKSSASGQACSKGKTLDTFSNPEEMLRVMKPSVIKEKLDEYVIGQDDAKKTLAIAYYNHLKRIVASRKEEDADEKMSKSDILMIGPTGCGKTHLIRALAKIVNVPLAVSCATDLTENGYIGKDVDSVLKKLILAAGNDVEKAKYGIVYIDEVDKLGGNETEKRAVGKEGVQQALLTLIEGADVEVTMDGNGIAPKKVMLDTRNILFICGGAFSGMEKSIRERIKREKDATNVSSIGFRLNDVETEQKENIEETTDNFLQKMTPNDLKQFGMIPEFFGRLPVRTILEELTVEALVKILSEPKGNLVEQFRYSFSIDGIDLVFEKEALNRIAEMAKAEETGARGLRGIVEEKMQSLCYEMPARDDVGRIIITRQFINGESDCILYDRSEQLIK